MVATASLPPSSVREGEVARGLTEAEATSRFDRYGPNSLEPPRRPSFAIRLTRQLREPMSLLLLVAASVSWLGLDEYVDAGAILAIVAANVAIALIQEGKARSALDALRAMEAPTATVVRDGRVASIAAHLVVPGDELVLSAGDRIPADAWLAEAEGLEVDESLLTGESLPVAKSAGAATVDDAGIGDQYGFVFSGTFVARGTARATVVATGSRTELGKIARHLDRPEQTTPLQKDLARTTARLGAVAVVVAAAVFGLTLLRTGTSGWEIAFLSAVALAVAAVPEGLPTVVTVALALGVRRMAAHRAIVRRLPAVETLGATTVILTDKTGTLTQNRMQVDAFVAADGNVFQAGTAGGGIGDRIGRVLALCNDAEIDPPWGDPMEIALLETIGQPAAARFRAAHPRIAVVPFDADRRRMTTVNRIGDGSVVAVKGAPETVLERCLSKFVDGRTSTLDPHEREWILERAGELARSGARVLALADAEVADEHLAAQPDASPLTFLALITIRDPVRPEAANAVSEGAFAGIRILMVTGDHPGTALAVAERVGLVGPSGRVLTGADIRRSGLPPDPTEIPVYARVDPDEKLAITQALQERGEVVAVTGDGVNDAPALRRADIGVAMGRSGSDVAREAADMVVTDDNLATIVEAVREGRGIYDNIRKVVEYLVAGNLSEILVVTTGLLFFAGLGVPLLPLQLLWINLLTDGFPALALGVDPVDPSVMVRPPRATSARLLGGWTLARLLGRAVLIASCSIAGLVVARYAWNEPWAHARTTMFSALMTAHLLYAFAVRRSRRGLRLRRNAWLVAAVGGGLVLQALVVSLPTLQEVFGTAGLSAREWALVAGLGVLPVLLMGIPVRIRRRGPGRGAPGSGSVRP